MQVFSDLGSCPPPATGNQETTGLRNRLGNLQPTLKRSDRSKFGFNSYMRCEEYVIHFASAHGGLYDRPQR